MSVSIKMFWSLLSFLCGVLVAQEFPNLPKLRPKLKQFVEKFTNDK